MLVVKFGGTSVADAERMRHVARIVGVARQSGPVVVVTSALGGVTDELLRAAHAAQAGNRDELRARLHTLVERHAQATAELGRGASDVAALRESVYPLLDELPTLLGGVQVLGELSPRSLDLLLSFGERLAAPLLAAALRAERCAAHAVDARHCLRTDDRHGDAVVDMAASRALTRQALLPTIENSVPVMTGFIAATATGVTTTLGRGGSDYSASLLGAFLDADQIDIYTDVDGVMTADPRIVPEARILTAISYREAAEMAYFGSKVLHPRTMLPAVQARIPIRLRSTFRPEHPGTLIVADPPAAAEPVKTVTSIAAMAMITVEGDGMIGVPGVASRVFAAAARAAVNVYLISQASSEHNISFVVARPDARAVADSLQREFALELDRGQIERIGVDEPVGIVAIVGEGMRGTPGVSQRMFGALGRAGVNVLAIAQGSSELNLSAVVSDADLPRAVGAVHSGFGLTQDLHVFLLGKGLVGSTLIRQIVEGRQQLAAQRRLTVRVIGVAGRDELLLDPRGLNDETLLAIADGRALRDFAARPRPSDERLLDEIANTRRFDVVLVDLTAAETGPLHRAALERGLHVVTANKKPVAGPLPLYQEIRELSRQRGLGYLFETTFGAGLPLLFALQSFLSTRDEIARVSGCFSGTLGLVCQGLMEGRAFSEVVREAQARGFTEPDPRDDLSGVDVARKALIIARELGHPLEMDDIALEGLVPAPLMELATVAEFLAALPGLDRAMVDKVAAARSRGEVLRFVAEITPEEVTVGLRSVPTSSPLAALEGPDNLALFESRRYQRHPLVIRGPGAGAEVTAAGVYTDILKLAGRP